jgi:hypothetical protein
MIYMFADIFLSKKQILYRITIKSSSQICSPFDKNRFSSKRRKHVEANKFDELKIKNIESKHKII